MSRSGREPPTSWLFGTSTWPRGDRPSILYKNILYFTWKQFHRLSLVLELNSRAFEPARATRKLSRIHHLHGDVPVHPRRGRLKLLCRRDSPFYHTRNRRCYLKLRKTSEARTGLTYKDSAVCSENILADFLLLPACLISYKLLADFSPTRILFQWCILQICCQTLKLRLIVLNCQR